MPRDDPRPEIDTSEPDRRGREVLSVERSAGGVATVILHGTGRGNALGRAVWDELPRVFDDLSRDAGVAAVVLRGAGADFSVGLDLRWFAPTVRRILRGAASPAEASRALLDQSGFMQTAVERVFECAKPVFAAIHGRCIGGGLDIATACDVRLAAADAVLSVREVRLGFVSDLGALERLPQLVGEGHARELALTGRDTGAEEAARIGLVNRVYSTAEATFAAAQALAEEVAANPPGGVAGTKEVMRATAHMDRRDALAFAGLWNAAFFASGEFDAALREAMQESSEPERESLR